MQKFELSRCGDHRAKASGTTMRPDSEKTQLAESEHRSADSTQGVPAAARTTAAVPLAPAGTDPPRVDELPQQFGRYRLIKRLGRGGMGSVYLAHDGELDRQVALKVPRFSSDEDTETRQRFQREARAAATIEHPNICPIYDVGASGGIPYVTMAYIEGRTLAQLIKHQPRLPARPVAAVVRKLALAMHAAHSRGVVHRDLKPANVMINKQHEPIVMDFGLARRASDVRLTTSGAILGTPAYMSPEQARGEESGQAADIYSLGVILYELLTGRTPFTGDIQSVLAQVLSRPPDPPTSHNPEADPALSAICLKAMSKQPGDRYRSMQELAKALQSYLKGEPPPEIRRGDSRSTGANAPPLPPPLPAESSGGESPGLATQLLARLDEKFDSHAAAAAAKEQPRAGQWILAMVSALAIIAVVLIAAAALNQRQQIDVKSSVVVQVQNIVPDVADPIVMMILLDGRPVTREELAQPMRLAAGKHELTMTRRDGRVITKGFEVEPPPEADRTATADPAPGSSTNRTAPQVVSKSPAASQRRHELTSEEKVAFADNVSWDVRALEEHFRILERTYDAQRDQLLWLLEAKAATKFRLSTPFTCKFYDAQGVKVYECSLQLQPTDAEAVGDRVRALMQLPAYRAYDVQDPRTTTVRVVFENRDRKAAPGS